MKIVLENNQKLFFTSDTVELYFYSDRIEDRYYRLILKKCK